MYFIHLEHKCQTDDTEIELESKYLRVGIQLQMEFYHPFWAGIPNNLTLGKHIVSGRPRHRRGCHPLQRAIPSNLGMAGPPRKRFSQLYFKLILKQCNSTPLIILVYTCHLQSCCQVAVLFIVDFCNNDDNYY